MQQIVSIYLAAFVALTAVGSAVSLPQAASADFAEFSTAPALSIGIVSGGVGSGSVYDKISNINDGVQFSAVEAVPTLKITPCNVNEPTKNECIRDLLQKVVPNLKNGLPEYNMNSIDPYFYKRGIFRYANEGVQGGLLIKNMYIHGISELRFNNVNANFTGNDFIVKANVELPKLRAGGLFKADVKFGGLRLVPKGPFNITIDNIKATILTDGTIFETEEKAENPGKRLKLQRLNANVAIGNARIIANGIFSDRNLNTMMLNLVNENLPEITRIGIPATREQWAPILVAHINDFFANIPIEKFLVQQK